MRLSTGFMLAVMVAALSGCQAGVELASSLSTDAGETDTTIQELVPLDLMIENGATVTWPEPESGADSYQLCVGANWTGACIRTVQPACDQGRCTLAVPLPRGGDHQINMRYFAGAQSSPSSFVIANSDWHESSWTGSDPFAVIGLVSAVGDIDGDGDSDALFGGNLHSWLFKGRSLLSADNVLAPEAHILSIDEGSPSDIGIGDVTGDGRDDLLLSPFLWPADNRGRVFIIPGSPSLSGELDLEAGMTLTAPLAETAFGRSFAVGNINGDAGRALIVGEPMWEPNPLLDEPINMGRLHAFTGGITASLAVDDSRVADTGAHLNFLGTWVRNVGDVDADGLDEFLYNSVETPLDLTLRILQYNDATASLVASDFRVMQSDTPAVRLAGTLGDIDGDGFNDFFITLRSGGVNTVAVFRGGETISTTPVHVYSDAGVTFGTGVAAADYDGDGVMELLIGSNTDIQVYEGPDFSGTPRSLGYAGRALIVRDFDGNGLIDILSANPVGGTNNSGEILLHY
jgi:hypothetical protein